MPEPHTRQEARLPWHLVRPLGLHLAKENFPGSPGPPNQGRRSVTPMHGRESFNDNAWNIVRTQGQLLCCLWVLSSPTDLGVPLSRGEKGKRGTKMVLVKDGEKGELGRGRWQGLPAALYSCSLSFLVKGSNPAFIQAKKRKTKRPYFQALFVSLSVQWDVSRIGWVGFSWEPFKGLMQQELWPFYLSPFSLPSWITGMRAES